MKRVQADANRVLAGTSVTANYAALGAALTNVWIMMAVKNNTNQTVWISENGTDDHYELPAGTCEYYDFQANTSEELVSGKAVGTQFYVKAESGSLPDAGRVVIQGQYL